MKLAGLDYGRRRIGMAITDELCITMRGLATIDRLKDPAAIKSVCHQLDQEKPGALVIGLPLDIDGNDTEMSREVKKFADTLTPHLKIPVFFVDESLSSVRSHDILKTRKKKHRQSKENVDRIAACLILESYLREHPCLESVL